MAGFSVGSADLPMSLTHVSCHYVWSPISREYTQKPFECCATWLSRIFSGTSKFVQSRPKYKKIKNKKGGGGEGKKICESKGSYMLYIIHCTLYKDIRGFLRYLRMVQRHSDRGTGEVKHNTQPSTLLNFLRPPLSSNKLQKSLYLFCSH
jgi:hypothetical protein